ncbi:MAG: LptF/LptG family permease, partial [Planctomycetota bacterium]
KWRDFASTSELIEQLRSPSIELGNDVRVAVHRRFLQPVMDVTLLMLGLPLVVSRGNSNAFVAIGLAVGVITAFFLVSIGAQSLGGSGWIRPELAAWLPLLVFVPIATAVAGALRR